MGSSIIGRTTSSTVYNERTIDILSALELAETALYGTPCMKRILVTRMALSITEPKRLFSSDQLTKLGRLLASLEHLIQMKTTIESVSSSTFMYWHHETMLPVYLTNVLDQLGGMDADKIMVSHF